MIVIPAIDIFDGKCVRLTQGDFLSKKSYHENPVDVAKKFEDVGCKRLHVVDLDGAKQKKIVNHAILEEICSRTNLIVDFGGGIQSDIDIKIAFECGAHMITAGSVAVKKPSLVMNWLNLYGADKIILGADVIEKTVVIHGWTEKTNLKIDDFLNSFKPLNIKYCICTDVSKDGTLQGPSISLYKELINAHESINFIASGGVSSLNDIHALEETNVFGVIVGKAIYEKKILLTDLINYW